VPCDKEIVVHVPVEKRVALDFYKNNTLHFFLLAALLIEGLGRGLRGSDLDQDAAWWLDLLRWEFPLPERDRLVGEFDRLRQDLRAEGVLVGNDGEETLAKDHPLVDTTRSLLDNFREAYWVAATVLMSLPEERFTRGVVLERMHARYETGLLLGEVTKPEGNSRVTLGNTLSRFAEIDCIKIESADKAKDSTIQRGACFGDLLPVAERIRASLGSVPCG
jgi:hypothetical protein